MSLSEETRWESIRASHEAYLRFATLAGIPEGIKAHNDAEIVRGVVRNVKRHIVQYGDTLPYLANKFNVAQEDIIVINNLEYPFVDGHTDETTPGVAVRGQEVLVPYADGELRPTRQMTDEERIEQTFYVDLLAVPMGDKDNLYDVGTSAMDLAVITGQDNLMQATRFRMRRKQGWAMDYPLDGVPDELGSVADRDMLLVFKQKLEASIRIDPRIASVKIGRVWFEDNAVYAEWSATAVDGTKFPSTAALVG